MGASNPNLTRSLSRQESELFGRIEQKYLINSESLLFSRTQEQPCTLYNLSVNTNEQCTEIETTIEKYRTSECGSIMSLLEHFKLSEEGYCSSQATYYLIFRGNHSVNLKHECLRRKKNGIIFTNEEVRNILSCILCGLKEYEQLFSKKKRPIRMESVLIETVKFNGIAATGGKLSLQDPWLYRNARNLDRVDDRLIQSCLPSPQKIMAAASALGGYDDYRSNLFSTGMIGLILLDNRLNANQLLFQPIQSSFYERPKGSLNHEKIRSALSEIDDCSLQQGLGILLSLNPYHRERIFDYWRINCANSYQIRYIVHSNRSEVSCAPNFNFLASSRRHNTDRRQRMDPKINIPSLRKSSILRTQCHSFDRPDSSTYRQFLRVNPQSVNTKDMSISFKSQINRLVPQHQTPMIPGLALLQIGNNRRHIARSALTQRHAHLKPMQKSDVFLSNAGPQILQFTQRYKPRSISSNRQFEHNFHQRLNNIQIPQRKQLVCHSLQNYLAGNVNGRHFQNVNKPILCNKNRVQLPTNNLYCQHVHNNNSTSLNNKQISSIKQAYFKAIVNSEQNVNNKSSKTQQKQLKLVSNLSLIIAPMAPPNSSVSFPESSSNDKKFSLKWIKKQTPEKFDKQNQTGSPSNTEQTSQKTNACSPPSHRSSGRSVDKSIPVYSSSSTHYLTELMTPPAVKKNSRKYNSTIIEVSEDTPIESEGSSGSKGEYEFVVEEYATSNRYEGFMKNGKKNGKGKFYYKDGGHYDGQWKNNEMHGYGRLFYSGGQLAYEGSWAHDEFHGSGKVYNDCPAELNQRFDYTNFDMLEDYWQSYQGMLANDIKEGRGTILLTNGEIFDGDFHNDKIEGFGKFLRRDGTVIEGVWKDSKLLKILTR